MDKNKVNNIEILNNFHEKCTSLKIWYSLSNLSLLSYQTENKFTSNNPNVIEVMMDIDSYNKFFRENQKNIIDNLSRNDYFYSNPIYFEANCEVIIKINLLIQANIKKTEKFYSIKNLIRQNIGYYRSKGYFSSFKDFLLKLTFNFFDLFYSPLLWHEISSHIYEKNNFQGYFIVDSFRPNINQNWIPSITGQVIEVEWNNTTTYVLKEWEMYLTKKYSYDWKNNPNLSKEKDFSFIFDNYIKH